MKVRPVALLGVLSLLTPGGALSGQTMRSYAASRPLTAHPPPLRATLDFGSGRVIVRAGESAQLYSVRMEYDADRFSPLQRFDVRTGILRLGVTAIGSGGLRVTSREHLRQAARFEFARGVPMSLEANLGASEAYLDLGDLALHEVTVRAGASQSTVTATTPTTARCERARFTSGASELHVTRLANIGCRVIQVEGGAGRAVLDFSGRWSTDLRLEATQTAGALTLQVPKGIGVQLRATGRFLSRLTLDGLVRQGDLLQSPDFRTAAHHLTIDLTTNVAEVVLEWIDR